MAKNMLTLLAPLAPRPAPSPPAPPPPPPAPEGVNAVIIYQQGGNGTLLLGPSNFSATKGMPGKGWDACPGPNGPAHFSNGGVRRHASLSLCFLETNPEKKRRHAQTDSGQHYSMYILNAESGTGFICTALTWPSSGMGEMQVQGAKHACFCAICI